MDDARLAVIGHSMGGGGVLLAASGTPGALKAAIALCPWSSDVTTFPGILAPALIVAGERDAIAPAAKHAYAFYESIPVTTQKAYVEVAGADHYTSNDPLANPAVARQTLSWLKVHVSGDARYGRFVAAEPALSRFESTATP